MLPGGQVSVNRAPVHVPQPGPFSSLDWYAGVNVASRTTMPSRVIRIVTVLALWRRMTIPPIWFCAGVSVLPARYRTTSGDVHGDAVVSAGSGSLVVHVDASPSITTSTA